jgi:hypothetical protein
VDRLRSTRRSLAVVALCAIAYLYVFPYHPKIGNPNEKLRLYMTAAIVEEGSYAVNTFRQRWGWVNDAALVDGKFYSVKAPGTSFLGVPAYYVYHRIQQARGAKVNLHVATWLVRVTAVIFPTLLFLFFFHRWLGRHSSREWLVDGTTLGLALASPAYAYAVMFVSHTLTASAVFVAFSLLEGMARERRCSGREAFLAGLFTAAITLLAYPAVLLSLLFSLWALVRVRPYKRLVPFTVGGLLPTLAVMHFHWKAYGSPFKTGHLTLENKAFSAGHEEGLMGATSPSLEGLVGLTLDPRQGLFPLAPWLLFAVVGFVVLAKRRSGREAGLIALVGCLLVYLFTASLNIWHAGWSIGPRYLAPLLPLLAFVALVGAERLCERWPRATASLFVGGLGVGLLASGIASAYYPHIPVDMLRMLPDLFLVAFRHDYAPYNALNLLGVWGTLSMVPLFALLLAVLGRMLFAAHREQPSWRVPLGAFLALSLLALPVLVPVAPYKRGTAHVLRNWSPDDQDRAARLATEQQQAPTLEGLERLEGLYLEEKRVKEAAEVGRRIKKLKKDPK